MDAIEAVKAAAREGWSTFTPFEMITCTAAPHLVRFAGVSPGARVLDVGCGTGVVALTCARKGAVTSGLDLSPVLIERARVNAEMSGFEIDFHEGDVEALPFEDASFDYVLSQFGHMFGPRPEIATGEMLRVLKPGGTIAFSTWPPELFTGKMFMVVGRYAPPPPPGVASPVSWGDPEAVRERRGEAVEALCFDRARMRFPTLSPAHMREFLEANIGPVGKLTETMEAEPARLASFREELEALIAEYFDDNIVRQDFLISRAIKR